jgi:hypothetical protein
VGERESVIAITRIGPSRDHRTAFANQRHQGHVVCGIYIIHAFDGGPPMDEKPRRDDAHNGQNREASDSDATEQRDELARRREQSHEHPALTRREREERWPIG